MTEIIWKMQKDELGRIKYFGSNGVVISRKGVGQKVWMGRNRSKPKAVYYQIDGKGFYPTLANAKQEAEKGQL